MAAPWPPLAAAGYEPVRCGIPGRRDPRRHAGTDRPARTPGRGESARYTSQREPPCPATGGAGRPRARHRPRSRESPRQHPDRRQRGTRPRGDLHTEGIPTSLTFADQDHGCDEEGRPDRTPPGLLTNVHPPPTVWPVARADQYAARAVNGRLAIAAAAAGDLLPGHNATNGDFHGHQWGLPARAVGAACSGSGLTPRHRLPASPVTAVRASWSQPSPQLRAKSGRRVQPVSATCSRKTRIPRPPVR